MPSLVAPPLNLPAKAFPGTQGAPSGIAGELLISALLPKYSTLVKAGKVQIAYATLTAPVIFSTAAGTGGPFIWNKPSSGVEAHILAIGVAGVVASAAAGAIGFTGAAGQTAAPTNTAIDAVGNAYVGGGASAMGTVARVATPTNAGSLFVPIFDVGTTALTAQFCTTFFPLDGAFVVAQGSWGSVAASATLTTAQLSIALVWAELPA